VAGRLLAEQTIAAIHHYPLFIARGREFLMQFSLPLFILKSSLESYARQSAISMARALPIMARPCIFLSKWR
jgi:hypothetical protein